MNQANNKQVDVVIPPQKIRDLPAIYANHSMISVNSFESVILFSYIDGFDGAEAMGKHSSKGLDAKPVAKTILPHRALLDLYNAIGGIIKEMQKDGILGIPHETTKP